MDFLNELWATYSTLIFTLGVHALLALSIYLTLSCGLLSLANAAFMGIGAYTAALCTMNTGLPFALSLLVGSALPAVIAVLIGIPVLRLSGVYLAMATLGFGEVVRVVLLNLEITGGPMGLNGIPTLTEGWHIFSLLAITIYAIYRLRHAKVGRAFEAIKEDEVAAQLMGINVKRYKLLAFVLGAMIAGLAGGLNAHFTFFLSPREYGFGFAVDILTMAVLGGANTLVGPMIGSSILTLLPELLRFLKEYRMAINGLVLIVVILYLPNGLWNPRGWRQWRQARRTSKGVI